MAYTRGLLCRAAALAMAASALPIAASAETSRGAVRGELRLSPLGAGGAIDPITIGMRNDEIRIGEASGAQRPSLIDRLVRGASPEKPITLALSRPSEPEPAPVQTTGKQWPLVLDDARRPVGIMERALPGGVGGNTPIVLAALDTQPASASTSDSLGLAWAPAPQVPNPISKRQGAERRLPRADAGAIAVMPAPPPARDAITEFGLEPQRLFLPFAGEQLSANVDRKLSHRAEPMWRARLPRSEPPTRDPFAEIEVPKPVVTGPAFIMPFENGRVSSLYNQGRRHPAIDLAGRMGSPVFSTSSNQTVTFAGWRGGYGNAVITRDKDGREHLYGHLSAIHVRPGKVLQQGERLGLLGSTGYSTGPHVHYEVKDKRGTHINPVTLLFPKGVRNGYAWAGTGLVRSEPTQTADVRR